MNLTVTDDILHTATYCMLDLLLPKQQTYFSVTSLLTNLGVAPLPRWLTLVVFYIHWGAIYKAMQFLVLRPLVTSGLTPHSPAEVVLEWQGNSFCSEKMWGDVSSTPLLLILALYVEYLGCMVLFRLTEMLKIPWLHKVILCIWSFLSTRTQF